MRYGCCYLSSVAKPNPVLAFYLQSLAKRPILTKSTTSAVLGFISEILAGHLASSLPAPLAKNERTGIAPVDWLKTNQKAVKLALYGCFLSPPLGHALLGLLQKAFEGKTSARAKLLMILCANIFISPIQQTVYLAAMAVINGATTSTQITKTIQAMFWPVMRLTWIISPLSIAFAQRFLEASHWVPFFSLVSALAGTVINAKAKKAAVIQAKKTAAKKAAEEKK